MKIKKGHQMVTFFVKPLGLEPRALPTKVGMLYQHG